MFDIAVIGAGVVGGLVARELTKYTKSVCIVEAGRDVALGATKANSAIVHAGFDAACGSLKARLNVRGSEIMEELCENLGVKYQNNGSLVVGFGEDDRESIEELYERGVANGVKNLQILTREEVLAIEKNIGEGVTHALYAPTGAIVCPYELCIAAVGNAMDNGAVLKLDFDVEKIEKCGGGYRVSSATDSIDAKIVINCAGINSDYIARLVGDESFTVHARRGEYLLLDREVGDTVSHTVFRCPSKMGKGVLVTPTVDGNLLVGPSAEDIEDKGDVDTTAAAIGWIKARALEQVGAINFAKTITTFAGLRAVGSTGDFIIKERELFVNVAAIESPGLSASPAIAEYVVSLLLGAGVSLEARADFNPRREAYHAYREMSVEEKNELIKRNPTYAHVICRCEGITEGEIIDALRKNPRPRDLDGIKRRTRASMGRCQGGFCTPYLIELLAREMGVGYEEVTKFGGDSRINIGKTKEVF